MDILDPTSSTESQRIEYAPRPTQLEGLRVGLVENTKFNSNVLLKKIAERLNTQYKMEMIGMTRKESPSHPVPEDAMAEFKTKADFVIAGIGD